MTLCLVQVSQRTESDLTREIESEEGRMYGVQRSQRYMHHAMNVDNMGPLLLVPQTSRRLKAKCAYFRTIKTHNVKLY